ncbi:MAG: T9SS type A sorting domain-containing protein [bacterium]|nr:T9SS type A sorting domain-containing protein [bacterium]
MSISIIRTGAAVIVVTLLTVLPAFSQVTQEWVRYYDGSGNQNDQASAMVVDPMGNVIVTGQSQGEWLTIKYDSDGNTLWSIREDEGEWPTALAVDEIGDIYLTGYKYTGSAIELFNIITIKYNADGDLLWGASYNGPSNLDDLATAICLDDSGYIYVTGSTVYSFGTQDLIVIKYDSTGGYSSTWPNTGLGIGVRIYNGGGSNGYDCGQSIAVDHAGNVYVTGESASGGSGSNMDYATLKYSASGNQLWAARYDGPVNGTDTPVGLVLDDLGNVYVAGTSLGFMNQGNYRNDYATVKYDGDGNQMWAARYDGPIQYEDYCHDIAIDAAANIYVTGCAANSSYDIATVKYNSNGTELWVAIYDGSNHNVDQGNTLMVDQAENVYVAGQVSAGSCGWDIATVKYDAAGTQIWAIEFNAADSLGDRPVAIALDSEDNVYVHGTSGTDGAWDNYVTIKYNQVNGIEPGWSSGNRPISYKLNSNFPNPFNPTTTISYSLPTTSLVNLSIYDVSGKKVAELVNGMRAAGAKKITFDGSNLTSGIYFCRLQAGEYSAVQKMILLK